MRVSKNQGTVLLWIVLGGAGLALAQLRVGEVDWKVWGSKVWGRDDVG